MVTIHFQVNVYVLSLYQSKFGQPMLISHRLSH